MMEQREIQDQDKTTWTCIQAFAGSNGEAARIASKKVEENGMVPVVCTPSGGAQTVRLDLPQDWLTKTSDGELMNAILEARDKS